MQAVHSVCYSVQLMTVLTYRMWQIDLRVYLAVCLASNVNLCLHIPAKRYFYLLSTQAHDVALDFHANITLAPVLKEH